MASSMAMKCWMAPPFKKLKNPILRKSVANVATLKQPQGQRRRS
jgi:hypothetical protein